MTAPTTLAARYGRAAEQIAAETWPHDSVRVTMAGALAEAQFWKMLRPTGDDENATSNLTWIIGRPARLAALRALPEDELRDLGKWVIVTWLDLALIAELGAVA